MIEGAHTRFDDVPGFAPHIHRTRRILADEHDGPGAHGGAAQARSARARFGRTTSRRKMRIRKSTMKERSMPFRRGTKLLIGRNNGSVTRLRKSQIAATIGLLMLTTLNKI